jgi:hypothetical protein
MKYIKNIQTIKNICNYKLITIYIYKCSISYAVVPMKYIKNIQTIKNI